MATELQVVRKRKSSGFFTILKSAACEWFLIILLFMGALFSYMLRKFAHYCELEAPCPLCSMLDHVFWKKKPGSYWSLMCSFHKEEISSLVSCFTLGNLADVYGIRMCEECLISNSESHKLLIGKSWVDVERSVLQNLMMNNRGSSESMTCSCCKWKAKSNERLVELNKVGLGASRANAKPPLPKVRLRRRGCLKGLRGKFTAPKKPKQTGSNSFDPSACLGYSKPKLSSGSESETPLSGDDDDGGNVGSSGNNYIKFEDAVGFSRRHDMAVKNVVLNELKNLHPSTLDGMNEHCLEIIDKPIDDQGPCECVHTSDDACSSNSNSKNLTDSLSQISENMELSCEHELESLNASDSAKTEQDTEAVVQVSTSEVCSLLKRNNSSYESLDGISVDDIENESIVDRLKRQVEYDRSCIKSLFKELEEERNAAAVAAYETMAMITRLQDEKAALRMEALQYLRVVEETANDLLAEREKELEDMEYELEYYRNNESELGIETTSVDISQCLKELEKKVCMAHCGGNVDEMANGLNWKNKNPAPNGSP